MTRKSRRRVLQLTGVALATGIAGCGSDGGGTETGNGDGGTAPTSSGGGTTQAPTAGDDTATPGDDTATPADETESQTPSEPTGISPDVTYDPPVENPVGIGVRSARSEQNSLVVLGSSSGSSTADRLVVTDNISEQAAESYTIDPPSGGWDPSGITYDGEVYIANDANQTFVSAPLPSSGSTLSFDSGTSLPGTAVKGVHNNFNRNPVFVVTKDGSDAIISYGNQVNTDIQFSEGPGYGLFQRTESRSDSPNVWVCNPDDRTFYSVSQKSGEQGTIVDQFTVSWQNPRDCAHYDPFDANSVAYNLADGTIYQFRIPDS